MIIGEALPRNAQHFATKPAIVDHKKSITHRDLHLRTNRLGNYLVKQGLRKGDRVAVSCQNRRHRRSLRLQLERSGMRCDAEIF
jgi:acyl-CoA synthetase (AMP-forming)/AMP-acid ligase II